MLARSGGLNLQNLFNLMIYFSYNKIYNRLKQEIIMVNISKYYFTISVYINFKGG